jgi:hypothetical protein
MLVRQGNTKKPVCLLYSDKNGDAENIDAIIQTLVEERFTARVVKKHTVGISQATGFAPPIPALPCSPV